MRNRIAKAGYLMILAAVMIAFTRAFVTDSYPDTGGGAQFNVGPDSRDFRYTLWNTRVRRVVIDVTPATAKINVKLLDEDGINLLYNEGRVQPVLSLENVDGCDFMYQPPYRGAYLFIIENVCNQTADISQRVIAQGLEWDILQFSGVLAVAGTIFALLPRVAYLKQFCRFK